MTVRDLISDLIDCDMNSRVIIQINTNQVDTDSDINELDITHVEKRRWGVVIHAEN